MDENNRKWYGFIFSERGKDLGLLVMRVVFGGLMLPHGISKLADFANMSQSFPDPIGIGSKFSLILVTAAETGGAIFIILGFLTRLAAIPLMFNMCVAAFIAHAPFSVSGSELPLLYLGAFTVLLIAGAGRYSIDGAISKALYK